LGQAGRDMFTGEARVAGDEAMCGTVSIGIADSTHAGLEFSSLITAADKAMYRAKQDGRNRVVMHSAYAYA